MEGSLPFTEQLVPDPILMPSPFLIRRLLDTLQGGCCIVSIHWGFLGCRISVLKLVKSWVNQDKLVAPL